MVIRQREIQRVVRQGFTLMEVLVVVAIILILASLGGYYLIGQANEARKSAAKVQVRVLTQAAETYNLDHGGINPASLDILVQRDGSGKGPYLKNRDALLDPWGSPYQYNQQGPKNQGTQPDIWCQVPNSGEMIGNWGKTQN